MESRESKLERRTLLDERRGVGLGVLLSERPRRVVDESMVADRVTEWVADLLTEEEIVEDDSSSMIVCINRKNVEASVSNKIESIVEATNAIVANKPMMIFPYDPFHSRHQPLRTFGNASTQEILAEPITV
jgi:hypothetical protein